MCIRIRNDEGKNGARLKKKGEKREKGILANPQLSFTDLSTNSFRLFIWYIHCDLRIHSHKYDASLIKSWRNKFKIWYVACKGARELGKKPLATVIPHLSLFSQTLGVIQNREL